MSQDLEQQNQALEQCYRRMKWLAIAGWAGFALAVAGAVAFWLLVELPNRRARLEATRASIEHALADAEERSQEATQALQRAKDQLRRDENIQKLAALVKQLGGRIEKDDEGQVVAVDLSDTTANDFDLEELFKFPSLKTVDLKNTRVSNVGVATLKAALPHAKITRYSFRPD